MGKLGTTFTYTEKYIEAVNEIQDVELRNKINYDLCFYGVYGILPDDASDMSALFIKSVEVLIEGSHKYNEEQAERGRRGGRPTKVEDKEIEAAILRYVSESGGKMPTCEELGKIVGLSGAAIRKREPWINRTAIAATRICEK